MEIDDDVCYFFVFELFDVVYGEIVQGDYVDFEWVGFFCFFVKLFDFGDQLVEFVWIVVVMYLFIGVCCLLQCCIGVVIDQDWDWLGGCWGYFGFGYVVEFVVEFEVIVGGKVMYDFDVFVNLFVVFSEWDVYQFVIFWLWVSVDIQFDLVVDQGGQGIGLFCYQSWWVDGQFEDEEVELQFCCDCV